MEPARELAEAVRCEAQQKLGCVEVRARLQCPAEEAFTDARDDAQRTCLIHFQLGLVVSGIAEHQAIALTIILPGFMITQDDEGIVLMTGITSL